MKKVSLIFTFLLTTLLSFGQSDHLIPARDFNAYEGQLKESYDKVFPLLHAGFSQNPYARYTSMPSFDSEYAFSVEKIDGKYFILSNTLSENYWYARSKMAVEVTTRKMEINKELYSKIGELFKLLTKQTKVKVPKKKFMEIDGEMVEIEEHTVVFDGIGYYFTTTDNNGEIKTGETRSPRKDSKLGRVVEICDSLHSLKTENAPNDIDALIIELKQ